MGGIKTGREEGGRGNVSEGVRMRNGRRGKENEEHVKIYDERRQEEIEKLGRENRKRMDNKKWLEWEV